MLKDTRKVTFIKKGLYSYVNLIGEVFYLRFMREDNRYRIEGESYYISEPVDDPGDISSGVNLLFEMEETKGGPYVSFIGMGEEWTDMGKNRGSMLLLLNKYYQKYGYPK